MLSQEKPRGKPGVEAFDGGGAAEGVADVGGAAEGVADVGGAAVGLIGGMRAGVADDEEESS